MKLGIKNNKLIVDLNSFISAVITLAIVFMLTFISVFGILSLKEYRTEKENRNQIIVYLKDLEEEQKKEISKKLIELPGVNSLRYESKELALKAVMLELGMTVSENENPLEDAFYVYLKKDVNLEKLKNSLINMKEIDSFDFRTKAIEEGIKFNNVAERISINATIIVSLLTILMIYNIIRFSIISKKNEIHESLRSGKSVKELKKVFFVESVVAVLGSFGIAFITYLIIKTKLVQSINSLIKDYKTTRFTFSEIGALLIILVLSIVISYFINYFSMNKYFKNYTGDINLEEVDLEVEVDEN
ncbi:cell division protein FtsX [Oceanivirga salmonicida]|uniref:cell division protein FtsX n=1 Tax=Oceanivirga salmonicida TaxID=1769291 RepID=UPI0008349997|nr:permease-like cell division protein FtsX [Oceanivirga salmonicida]